MAASVVFMQSFCRASAAKYLEQGCEDREHAAQAAGHLQTSPLAARLMVSRDTSSHFNTRFFFEAQRSTNPKACHRKWQDLACNHAFIDVHTYEAPSDAS